jgi:hypothetical protein
MFHPSGGKEEGHCSAFQPDVRHAPLGYGVTAYGPKLARAAGLNLFFFQILVICLNILEIRSNF